MALSFDRIMCKYLLTSLDQHSYFYRNFNEIYGFQISQWSPTNRRWLLRKASYELHRRSISNTVDMELLSCILFLIHRLLHSRYDINFIFIVPYFNFIWINFIFVHFFFLKKGYGNISPSSTLGRMFMIFYALIGIPMNGFLFAYLGDFFGKVVRIGFFMDIYFDFIQ